MSLAYILNYLFLEIFFLKIEKIINTFLILEKIFLKIHVNNVIFFFFLKKIVAIFPIYKVIQRKEPHRYNYDGHNF